MISSNVVYLNVQYKHTRLKVIRTHKNIFDHVRILFMDKMSVIVDYIFCEPRIIGDYITIFVLI